MAGTLILEAIVVLLALPVVAVSHGGLTPLTGGYLIGLAVVLVLLAGIQGRPWAIWVNLAMQLVVIAGWAVHGAIGFIGVIFAGVWLLIVYLRAEVKRREERGLLPGQQRLDDVTGTLSAVTERTLVLIKPDGVKRRLVGEILSRIERKGLSIAALELKDVSEELARRHYAEHEGKPFFGSLLEFITSGPGGGRHRGRAAGRCGVSPDRRCHRSGGEGRARHHPRRPGPYHPGQPRARLRFARIGGPRNRALVPRRITPATGVSSVDAPWCGILGSGSRPYTRVGRPNEDLDERDHRHPRCGADRPAIIQPGTERVRMNRSARDHNKPGSSDRAHSGSPRVAASTRRARGLEENTWPTMPPPKTYQKRLSTKRACQTG